MARVELVSHTDEGEILIEKACRVCYQSYHRFDPPESTKTLIQNILQQGHFSVLEHAVATFRFNDVSRVLTHELVRHRLMSPSQESQRYVCYADKPETDQPGRKGKARKKTKEFSFTTPPDIEGLEEQELEHRGISYTTREATGPPAYFPEEARIGIVKYDTVINLCYEYYEHLLAKGIKPEDARYVLPNATNCDIYCTANLREWRHIFLLRCHPRAAWDIRYVMNVAKDRLKKAYPNVFFDFPKGPLTEDDYDGIIRT